MKRTDLKGFTLVVEVDVSVTTSQVLRLPVPRGISSYNIRLEGMDVEVQL